MTKAESTGRQRRISGVSARIGRVFTLQITLISLAVVGGVFATQWIVEDVLSREALEGEARHFWSRIAANPAHPIPDTDNMSGYLSRSPARTDVPMVLRTIDPGFGRVELAGARPLIHVSDGPAGRLYLVFRQDDVSNLTLYFGVLPLSVILLFIYALSFLTYRLSQRAVSPLVRLSQRLEHYDPAISTDSLSLDDLRGDAEVNTMIDALDQFTRRLESFVARERDFTRDASHELRTPIAVIRASLDLLGRNRDRPPADQAALERMRRTVVQMQGLIEGLLLLAREGDPSPAAERADVGAIVAEQVDLFADLARSSGNRVEVIVDGGLVAAAPRNLIAIAIANLLRNALTYTREGTVQITVGASSVRIRDTGIGMTDEERARLFEPFFRGEAARSAGAGHGLGLAIVRRLADRFGWRVTIDSAPGKGTEIELDFGSVRADSEAAAG